MEGNDLESFAIQNGGELRKTAHLRIFFVVLTILVVNPGFGQTLEELRNKMIEAQGGAKALEGIKDMTMKGTLKMVQMGMDLAFVIYKKEPDKYRMDFEVMGMSGTQCYDGKTTWMINPQNGETSEMPEDAAKSMKRQALPLIAELYPDKFGVNYKLLDEETVDGKEYIILEQTFPDGVVAKLYVDPETYLTMITKSRVPNELGVEVDFKALLSDYREVGGIISPHSIINFQDGAESQNIIFAEIKINTGLEDSLFKMEK
jgi:outer membrane lipoprotein-sorting protein